MIYDEKISFRSIIIIWAVKFLAKHKKYRREVTVKEFQENLQIAEAVQVETDKINKK